MIRQNLFKILTISILVFGCKKDLQPEREFPQLQTLDVTDITSEGAIFHAEFLQRGNFEILEYGFVWTSNIISVPSLLNEAERVVIQGNIKENKFSISITKKLFKDVSYKVRAFVVTSDFTVYGKDVFFKSLGSNNIPEITSFEPMEGTWGDTIKISGENFSYNAGANIVKLGEVSTPIVYASDTLIKIVVPNIPNDKVVELSLNIAGNIVHPSGSFSYITPKIVNISPDTLWSLQEHVTIEAVNIHKKHDYLNVTVNGLNAKLKYYSGNIITFELPAALNPNPEYSVISDLDIKLYSAGFADSTTTYIKWKRIFTRKNDFPGLSRKEGVAFSIGDYGYFGGGIHWDGSTRTFVSKVDFWKYNPKTDEWSKIANHPGNSLKGNSAFSLNGYGYVGFGSDRVSWTSQILYLYDPNSNYWTRMNDYKGPHLKDFFSFTLNNRRYIGAGYGNRIWGINPITLDAVFMYDPLNDKWLEITPFPLSTRDGLGAVANNKAYVNVVEDFYEFDGEGWGKVNFEGFTRKPSHSFAIGNCIYFFFEDSGIIYEIDVNSGNKKQFQMDKNDIRSACYVFVLDNKAYFILGFKGDPWNYTNGVLVFDPSKSEF